MPQALLEYLGYLFYFWSNESGEPVHIHISKGKPSKQNLKLWIGPDRVTVAHNGIDCSDKELRQLISYVSNNRAEVVDAWSKHFDIIALYKGAPELKDLKF